MSDITRNNTAYAEIINKLPKPFSPEEQYLYSIACTVAEVPYEMPFQNAFWRKEQYLKAIWQIAIEKIQEPNIPDDNTVSTGKIINGAITEIKLAAEVTDKLLADNKIETSMLKNSAVTTPKIADGAISSDKLSDNSVTEIKLVTEVTARLLAENHTGIIKQPSVSQIAETGDSLTLDVVKNKINEIITALNNAQITS